MMAWILGLAFFAAWGALAAWKFAPTVTTYHMVSRSKVADFFLFGAAILSVLLSYLLIRWVMNLIFNSPVLESEKFLSWSLPVTLAFFIQVLLTLVRRNERQWDSPEGQKKLAGIIEEAARELEEEKRQKKT